MSVIAMETDFVMVSMQFLMGIMVFKEVLLFFKLFGHLGLIFDLNVIEVFSVFVYVTIQSDEVKSLLNCFRMDRSGDR